MDRNILKTVIADNQTEVPKYNLFPRDFIFEDSENYFFVGIPRVGKSFMLYQRMQQLLAQGVKWDEMLYINFEDERLISMTLEDLDMLLDIHFEMYGKKPILFLDEIQNIEGWVEFACRMADTEYRVLITGNNGKITRQDIDTSFGGRYTPVEIYPYSFKEFLTAKSIGISDVSLISTKEKAEVLCSFNDYLFFGGLPESLECSNKKQWLGCIYAMFFFNEIIAPHSLHPYYLSCVHKKLAKSIKQPLSIAQISTSFSLIESKQLMQMITEYVGYTKDAKLMFSIQNLVEEIVNKETTAKYYFTDNGILNLFLLNGNTSLLENLVAINLLRKYGRNDAVFFYNKGIEVDFYIPDEAVAIQVCYNLDNSDGTFDREVGALLKLSKVLECKKMMVITRDNEQVVEVDNKTIEVVPAWKWLFER